MAFLGPMRARRAVHKAARARFFGRLDEAYALTERALTLDPACEAAEVMLAELLPRGDDLAGAIDRLTALVDGGARSPRARLRLAACLLEADRADEALARLGSLSADLGVEDQLAALRARITALSRLQRWSEAIAALESLRALDAGHPVLHELAYALERAGRVDEARPLRRELARFRADDWYHFLRALPGPAAEAAAASLGVTLARALEVPPAATLARADDEGLEGRLAGLPGPWSAALRGQAHRAGGRSDRARAVLTSDLDHPVVRFESALLDMCADTIERSTSALDRLSDEGHPLPGLAYWRAVAHHAAGDDERAAALYRALIADDPEHGHAWWLLADVAGRLEGRAAKIDAERRAYKATPLLLASPLRSQLVTIVGVAARVRMGRLDDDDPQLVSACVAAHDDDRARALLSRWAARPDVDDETRLRLAWDAHCAGASPLVLRLLAPLVDAGHPEALALTGESMVLAGSPLEGAERLRRAIELDPSLTRAWDFFGVVMAKQRAWAEAELPLRRAAELGPEGPERHRNLAMLLLDTGRGAEAVAPAERAVAMLEVDGSSLGLLARVYQAAGDAAWATLAAWAADYHTEQRLHRAALGGVAGVLPGNVPPPPDLFRPTFGRFKRRLDEIAAGL